MNLYEGYINDVKKFDEYELVKSIRMLADLVEDGITYRKNRNDDIQCVTASAQAHRLAMEFIREHGLAAEYKEYVEKNR